MLMVRPLMRSSCVLSLSRRLAHSTPSIRVRLVVIHLVIVSMIPVIKNTIHALITFAIAHVFVYAETRPSPRAPALAFVMPRQCISASKSASAFRACMRSFSSVEFGVAFQVM